MIDILPFSAKHLDNFKPRKINPPDILDMISESNSPRITIVDGEETLAVIGSTYLYDGVSEIWTVTAEDDLLLKNIKEYLRILRIAIPNYMERGNLRRLQITIPTSFPTAKRWGEALGFTCEGVLKNYGWDNKDYYMFARYS